MKTICCLQAKERKILKNELSQNCWDVMKNNDEKSIIGFANEYEIMTWNNGHGSLIAVICEVSSREKETWYHPSFREIDYEREEEKSVVARENLRLEEAAFSNGRNLSKFNC